MKKYFTFHADVDKLAALWKGSWDEVVLGEFGREFEFIFCNQEN